MLCAVALAGLLGAAACSADASAGQSPDQPLPPLSYQLSGDPGSPPAPTIDPNAPSLDLRIIKSMLYAAAVKHRVNPNLVIRELGALRLYEAVPAGRTIPYQASGDSRLREASEAPWRALIPSGQLPPLTAPKKK